MTAPAAPRWLVCIHVASSVSVLGADLVLLALGIRGQAGADPLTVYPAMASVVGWVLLPMAMLALATGLSLATWGGRRWLLRAGWVVAKLFITTGLTVLVILVVLPGLSAAADASSVAATERLAYAVVPALTATLLLVNVVLGVTKPGR